VELLHGKLVLDLLLFLLRHTHPVDTLLLLLLLKMEAVVDLYLAALMMLQVREEQLREELKQEVLELHPVSPTLLPSILV
jgi:hypothetical protein